MVLPLLLITGRAMAAISGTDDFNDNSKDATKWGADVASGGVLTETSQRLQFTAATSGGGFSYRPWILNKAAYDTGWEVIIDVANIFNFTSGATREAGIQLLVFPTGTNPALDGAKTFTASFFADREGTDVFKGFLSGQGDSDTEQSQEVATNAGSLRMVYNGVSKIITSYYDPDGAANGYSWAPLGSLGINGSGGVSNSSWGLSGAQTLEVALCGFADGTAVTAGQMYADNFQSRTIAALPTPLGGSDDFNDNSKNTAKWDLDFTNGGLLSEVNSRLEYTIGSAAVDKYSYRPWIQNKATYDTSWDVTIDLTNGMDAAGTSWDSGSGIQIFREGSQVQSFFVELNVFRDAGALYRNYLAGQDDGNVEIPAPNTTGSVRIVFNAATKVLTSYYDGDGPANGYVWTPLTSMGIAGSGGVENASWGMAGSQGFDLALYGFSDGVAVPTGKIHVDNFSAATFTENFQLHEWKAAKFGDPTLPQAALTADSDNDGLTNLLEYALNLNPAKGELPVLVSGSGVSGLPRFTPTGSGATYRLRMEYVRRKASTNPGAVYTAQFSSNLADTGTGPWATAAGPETVTSIDTIWERVVVEDTAGAGQGKRFGRVKLTSP